MNFQCGMRQVPKPDPRDAELARLREIIARFRYASDWISADSWDFCEECRQRLQHATSFANEELGALTDNQIAEIGQKVRPHLPRAALNITPEVGKP